ncbi:hypothetical protein L227DRAFT_317548 [Lentinus tigrinus ALCF2SS1-6]|uniref:Uncharacterized protein n=1 Tax=Lentinus tigrinus ALCF2SS1-6 TaxID=1328759 RepID=A0A5C2SKB3_9APHY|nr:hypothetical protein L227DRAFT_317548 [Lentinus tigrinus ALCF2SS1-6]
MQYAQVRSDDYLTRVKLGYRSIHPSEGSRIWPCMCKVVYGVLNGSQVGHGAVNCGKMRDFYLLEAASRQPLTSHITCAVDIRHMQYFNDGNLAQSVCHGRAIIPRHMKAAHDMLSLHFELESSAPCRLSTILATTAAPLLFKFELPPLLPRPRSLLSSLHPAHLQRHIHPSGSHGPGSHQMSLPSSHGLVAVDQNRLQVRFHCRSPRQLPRPLIVCLRLLPRPPLVQLQSIHFLLPLRRSGQRDRTGAPLQVLSWRVLVLPSSVW